ncbi:hypothetical protein FIBSPDRAFT_303144 [Athelia psychrophila]|uniref:Uncharacterized protein n=1 Tax=Athelia psychrophila TaxID=1759441 RepID=A0A167X2Z2_9AGAM|nr:hypothetical protein FIBSPDRAFT_303144 [Fibularhizoctonia sp. CBS 109695]
MTRSSCQYQLQRPRSAPPPLWSELKSHIAQVNLATKHKTPSGPLAPMAPLPSLLLCPRRTFPASLILTSKFTQGRCYSNKPGANSLASRLAKSTDPRVRLAMRSTGACRSLATIVPLTGARLTGISISLQRALP